MCSTDPFQFRWLKGYIYSSCYYHHQVSAFPIVIIFFHSRVSEMFVTSYSRIVYTFRENWDFVFIIIVQFMMSANSRIHYGLQIVFVCLHITPSHYHHCANLSIDIGLMKCLPYIFCRVCEQDWAYSLSYPLFNIWGCMFSVHPILSWWLREYIALSYYHHQIGMNYYPLFSVRSWNNFMRCMSLYILIMLLQQLFIIPRLVFTLFPLIWCVRCVDYFNIVYNLYSQRFPSLLSVMIYNIDEAIVTFAIKYTLNGTIINFSFA